MKFAREIQLLKTLAGADGHSLGRQFLARKIDLPSLASFLYEEQLDIYFLALMEDQRLLKLLPRTMREQLLWLRGDQQKRNRSLLETLSRLQSILAQAGVQTLQLKGLPLAQRYWGGVERRFCWDLDLLVRTRDRSRAIDALESAGYTTTSPALIPRKLVYRLSHAVEISKGDLPVDLHWSFRQRPGFAIDYDAVWARRERWHDGELDCDIPSAQDSLLIMLLGIAQDAERGHCRYRKLWDIYLWLQLERDFDWEAFCRRCGDEGVEVLCLNMLALTLLALDCEEGFPGLRSLLDSRKNMVSCSAADVSRVLGRSRQHLANRLWFARLQQVPAWRYVGWWTLTAPMRYLLGRSL